MDKQLDIVKLIEKNPITRLDKEYNDTLVLKIKESFTEPEQQLFASCFLCYLNYNQKTDFVINLDTVWKWIGFTRKDHCKVVLKKHFTIDVDYKIFGEQNLGGAGGFPEVGGKGRPIEKIMLNINCFKKLCLKANTKKADEIHNYYIKIEELFFDTFNEQTNELRLQLINNDKKLIEQKDQYELEKKMLLEETLLNQFPENTQCIYIGEIDNKDSDKGTLVSFGMSNNLRKRIEQHKKTYTNYRLCNVFKVKNHIEIENCIKRHPILKKRIRYLMINNINYREHLLIDPTKHELDFSLEKLYDYIVEIIKEHEYNIENYNKLIVKCDNLQLDNDKLNEKIKVLENEKLELSKYKPTEDKPNINRSETFIGYTLFAFQTMIKDRYNIELCKTSNLENRKKALLFSNPECEIKVTEKIKHPFLEKVFLYLIKKHLVMINPKTYDGSIEDIQIIFNIIYKLEDIFVNNDIHNLNKILNNEKIELLYNDPAIPIQRKSKRSVDQVDPATWNIIATYPSIEQACRSIGQSGSSVGIALRNTSLSGGSGFSKDEQMKDSPVIRIKCESGEKTYYKNMASAAREANISSPRIRNRILTAVHCNGYHWIFDKNTDHKKWLQDT